MREKEGERGRERERERERNKMFKDQLGYAKLR